MVAGEGRHIWDESSRCLPNWDSHGGGALSQVSRAKLQGQTLRLHVVHYVQIEQWTFIHSWLEYFWFMKVKPGAVNEAKRPISLSHGLLFRQRVGRVFLGPLKLKSSVLNTSTKTNKDDVSKCKRRNRRATQKKRLRTSYLLHNSNRIWASRTKMKRLYGGLWAVKVFLRKAREDFLKNN